ALAPPAPAAATLALAIACFLSYGFGQALTDCFQIDTDSLSSPYRPLVQGAIRRDHVLMLSIAGLLTSGLIALWYQPANAALALLAVIGLATYTPFKRMWWGGPLYNAWIVAVLTLIAYGGALGAAHARPQWDATLAGTLVAVLFGYAVFVLAGYYKDVSADRATGYHTLPVVFGLSRSAWVCDAFATLELLGVALAAASMLRRDGISEAHVPGLVLVGAGTIAAVLAQLRLHRVREETEAHRAITPGLHAYVLLLGGLAALARPAWAVPILAFYGAFVLVLRGRPMRQQI
ncbi:MAG: UbiA family prenyltransferase, partial [Gemmatimonadales bacterium]